MEAIDRLVGHNIRIFRLDRGYTQESLADAIGVSFQQVQKYEKGKNRIGPSRLAKISQVLGVPIEMFFRGIPINSDACEHPTKFLADPRTLRLLKAFAEIERDDVRDSFIVLAEAFTQKQPRAGKVGRRPRKDQR